MRCQPLSLPKLPNDRQKKEEVCNEPLGEQDELVLLWDYLRTMVLKGGTAEADFIKEDVIGAQVIERNQVAHTEVASLLAILQDVRSGGARSHGTPQRCPLAASHTTVLLRQQLKLLLDQISVAPPPATAAAVGIPMTRREAMIAGFVRCGGSRPPSASATRRLVVPAPNELSLAQLRDRLRFDRVGEIASELRRLFDAEHTALVAAADELRGLIAEELEWDRFAEPTERELRDMSAKLRDASSRDDSLSRILALPPPTQRKTLPSLPCMNTRSSSSSTSSVLPIPRQLSEEKK